MRNLQIISVAFPDAAAGIASPSGWSAKLPSPGPSGGIKSTPELYSPKMLRDLQPLQKKKVELSVEQIDIGAQFFNIWIGDELLLGTMVDEKASRITGYISMDAPATGSITVEYPDGTRTSFDTPVS